MTDANASRARMPAPGQTLDLGDGYTIRSGGVLYYGRHVIRHHGVVIGTVQSRGEAADMIDRHERETPRESGYEEPSHADQ